MRGSDIRTGDLFSYVDLEQRVPANHPLRLIRRIVNEVLAALHSEFGRLYATEGRPSIAPERLLRALLLQAFYSIRSERQLMEQLHYNLLYRWFIGLGVDDQVWVPTVFTKNRDRLLEAEVARKFLAELLAHRDVRALLSDDHFSVDGTQVQAWASMKSFVANDGSSEPPSPGRNGERHFHREQRSNQTHGSITDPEAKLAKKGKGKEAKLAYTGNVMTENRNGFVVEAELRQVSGAVERETAKDMIVRYSPGARLCIRHAGLQRYTARGAKHDQSTLRHRRSHYPPLRIRGQPAEAQTGRGAIRVGQDHWRIGAANAAWREEAGLQVHADNGCLRSHQVAQVDRSNRLNDSRLPNRQCRQRFKLADNANPKPMPT